MTKTKIVATLGPSTDSDQMITKLINLGVNVFRLNFSHGDHEYHKILIQKVRSISSHLKKPVALLQDISGPKIRVGQMEPLLLNRGDHLQIFKDALVPAEPNSITINHPEVLDDVQPGQMIYFADGTICAEVEKNLHDRITTKVLTGGKLSTKKGVNLPVSGLRISAITQKDREDITFGIAHDVDLIALSFVRSATDVLEAKQLVKELSGDVPVFAKIEKAEAVDNLEGIIAASDGLMIARGDLGVEMGIHQIPVIQKKILKKASEKGTPVIIATQMLTSMLSSPYPTRAEVSDVANAVLDGADAVMLSDETTVGKYPEEAITVLVDTLTATEEYYPWFRHFLEMRGTRRAMAAAAVTLSESTGSDSIVSFTETGLTALMVARQRPKCRIIANTSNLKTYRRLSVVWGVEPFAATQSYPNSDEAIYNFFRGASATEFIDPSKDFIVTISRHSNKSGSTNVVQLIDSQCITELETVFLNQ